MDGDLSYLPTEIMTEILSRVPAQTIQCCKYVCKSWHDLISTREFAKFHLSKSIPGVAIIIMFDANDKPIDALGLNFSPITKIYSTYYLSIHGSADGLLLLYEASNNRLHLCNPITREYIDLHHSNSQPLIPSHKGVVVYGFGISKISGQYKVVAISSFKENECKVYTIGSGSWRSIGALLHFNIYFNMCYRGVFVNGSLHWLVKDLNDTLWICCFDLETEIFTTISLPHEISETTSVFAVVAVEGNLGLCEYTSTTDKIVTIIWLMKEYGVWTKKFVIPESPAFVYPIRLLEDGVILTGFGHYCILYYSIKNKTMHTICKYNEASRCVALHSHTPSFLSLKCFTMENSILF